MQPTTPLHSSLSLSLSGFAEHINDFRTIARRSRPLLHTAGPFGREADLTRLNLTSSLPAHPPHSLDALNVCPSNGKSGSNIHWPTRLLLSSTTRPSLSAGWSISTIPPPRLVSPSSPALGFLTGEKYCVPRFRLVTVRLDRQHLSLHDCSYNSREFVHRRMVLESLYLCVKAHSSISTTLSLQPTARLLPGCVPALSQDVSR